jgi:hypothetical protein
MHCPHENQIIASPTRRILESCSRCDEQKINDDSFLSTQTVPLVRKDWMNMYRRLSYGMPSKTNFGNAVSLMTWMARLIDLSTNAMSVKTKFYVEVERGPSRSDCTPRAREPVERTVRVVFSGDIDPPQPPAWPPGI